ncbi:MAG: CBS domain-containing protein [Bernardetiaceae bacterium]|jgi:CBS domain-containing protein|nr:CBS domain-containing protein [Bernardetiaceae bacterium]
MTAQEFINPLVPPLKLTDTVQKALNWMNEFRVHQLPVVDESHYLGILAEDQLYESTQPDEPVGRFQFLHPRAAVSEHRHFYDVIKEAHANDLQVIAVVDDLGRYKGAITIKDTVTALARTYATQSPGGIIVLSMPEYDYSLAEIARLVESNNAKILSSYVESDPYDPTLIKVTLKLNLIDLTRVIATLERFEYRLIAKFQEMETVDHDKDRLGMLLRYLEI